MSWKSLEAGQTAAPFLGIDWAGGGVAARQADPYLFWAGLTGFRTYLPPQRAPLRLAAFELANEVGGEAFLHQLDEINRQRWLQGRPPLLQLAPHYVQHLRQAQGPTRRHFVGWVLVEEFAGSALAQAVRRYRVALVGATEAQAPAVRPAVTVAPPAGRTEAPAAAAAAGRNDAPVLGVIDIGCAFAHPRLARAATAAWRTRVTHLWDMGRDAGAADAPLWRACADFGYGREADAARLDALIAQAAAARQHTGPPGDAEVERLCYRAAGLPELLSERKRWSHGTMVMDIAAGAEPGAPAAVDAAAAADIVFVQLPPEAVEDLSCGWLTPHVIDALNYILARAAGRQVVVNLSFGAYAGSHDGESLLEAALDAVAQQHDAVLVLSAGNARGQGLHARATLAPGATKTLQWMLPRDDATQSFLELWSQSADGGRGSALEVTLAHPLLPAMPPLAGAGAAWFAHEHAPQRPVAAVLQVPHTRAGGPDGLVLVSLGPTDRETPLPHWEPVRAPSGYWSLSVRNAGAAPVEVHAWVERDDPDLTGRSEYAQSRLLGTPDGFEVDDAAGLTGQACGRRTIVVGSRIAGEDEPMLAPDSSTGPARRGPRRGPDLVAAGVQRGALGLVGMPALTNLSGEAPAFLSGTSLSAPRVTRAAFNLLAAQGVQGGAGAVLGHWFAEHQTGAGGRPPPMSQRNRCIGLGWLDDQGRMQRL